jgi:hypothetical protein
MSLDTIQPQLSIVFPCSVVGHRHTLIINPLVYVTLTLIILFFLFCHFSDQAFKMEVIVGRIAPFSFPFIFSTQVWLALVCMFVCHFHHPNMHYSFLTYLERRVFAPLNSKFSNMHLHLYVLNMSCRWLSTNKNLMELWESTGWDGAASRVVGLTQKNGLE